MHVTTPVPRRREGAMPSRQLIGSHRCPGALLAREQEGAVLVLTALLMVVLIGFVGLVVDSGHQMVRYREAQNAADAAALAGAYALYAGDSVDTATNEAKLVAQQNGYDSSTLTLSFLDGSNKATTLRSQAMTVRADVRSSFPTYLVRLLGLVNQSVAVNASAEQKDFYACELCVLDSGVKDALKVNGKGGINLSNVDVVDDSSNAGSALDAVGNGTMTDGPGHDIGVVGGYTTSGGGSFSPTPTTGISSVPDPLASLPAPSPSAYTTYSSSADSKGAYSLTGSSSGTLQPGVYTTIKDTSSGTLTLSPGIYIITGALDVTGKGNLVGPGVMLFFACPAAHGSTALFAACTSGEKDGGTMDIEGSGSVTLSAMSASTVAGLDPTGALGYADYEGLLIYYDRKSAASMKIDGSGVSSPGTLSTSGTIYGASSSFSLDGNGSATTQMDSMVVVDQLNVGGNSGSSGGLTMTFDRTENVASPILGGLTD